LDVTDLEEELRDLLRAKADGLPAQRTVPRTMLRRAKRRVAVTALSGLLVAAAVVAGGITGLRVLSSPRVAAGHTPTPSVASVPAPTPTDTPPQPTTCEAGDLTATFSRETGNAFGSIVVTNGSQSACTLTDRPDVTILDGNDQAYDVHMERAEPWWKVDGSGEPPEWPVVTVQPGGSVQLRVAIRNWCGLGTPARWNVSIPGDGLLEISRLPGFSFSACQAPSQPAKLLLGPFEPAS
jgi:Domain of unknown function (DUF4232)